MLCYFNLYPETMASMGFKLHKFRALLHDDGGRPPKHVAGKTICICTTCLVCAVKFL